MTIIDFHLHAKITCTFPFDNKEFLAKINEASINGLNAFALTEHSHTEHFFEAYDFLQNNYEYVDDYYLVDGIKVFVGVEVTTAEKLDILIIGSREYITNIRNSVEAQKGNEQYIAIANLFSLLEGGNALVILAHPYRRHNVFPEIDQSIFQKFDAIEINATDLSKRGEEETTRNVKELSKVHNQIPITVGSDAHYFTQVGSVRNEFPSDISSVKEFKEYIKNGNYSIHISDDLGIRVRFSSTIKKLMVNKETYYCKS